MNIPLFVAMIVCFLLVLWLIKYLLDKRKIYYVPSASILGLGFLLLGYTQVSASQGSWDDLGYVILGLMLIFLSIITALIVFTFRFFKYPKNDIKDR
ncbi:MAG: hypothetical protein KKH01_09410 [Firmicutes bacterium]|nr:hypothetical protein [Bacillota bacterium]